MFWHAACDLKKLPTATKAGRIGTARLSTFTFINYFGICNQNVALTEVTESSSYEVVTILKVWIYYHCLYFYSYFVGLQTVF